ncbi:MAG: murein L,D-transpeptidase catalytic domain family protein [bacterium]|nr:murein L,D-transpeptidase catalytic domain family protein [bacterium]
MRYLLSPLLLLCALLASPVRAVELADALAVQAPDANPEVLHLAQEAMACALADGMPASERLAIIDYSRPSVSPRLWVFDLGKRSLLFRELVAHGRNSGDNMATRFSNEEGSLATSLGLFRTQETYQGDNGYSLRMDGLEPGFNDHARARAIVMHGAPYVNEETAGKLGRLGRSWGCPAVRAGIAKRLIDTLKGGQFVFSYYPDQKWLTSSRFLNCKSTVARVSIR